MEIPPENGHLFQSPDEVESDDNSLGGTILRYIGGKGDMSKGPKAFLDEVVNGVEVESHFHPIDQYQILFGAPGAYYQRSPVPSVLLHYTDAYSVYGPFGAGPESSMHFLTLRATPSSLRGSMPQYRDQLLYRGRRHHLADLEPFLNAEPPAKGETVVDSIIPADPDGLASYTVRVGPGTETEPPKGDLRTGRYTVVLDGNVTYNGRTFGPKSVGWSTGDAPEVTLSSGDNGAVLLFCHMPYPDTPSVRLAEMNR